MLGISGRFPPQKNLLYLSLAEVFRAAPKKRRSLSRASSFPRRPLALVITLFPLRRHFLISLQLTFLGITPTFSPFLFLGNWRCLLLPLRFLILKVARWVASAPPKFMRQHCALKEEEEEGLIFALLLCSLRRRRKPRQTSSSLHLRPFLLLSD